MKFRAILAAFFALFLCAARGDRPVQAFASVIDLLASNPRTVNTNALVLGRDWALDGAEGPFYYDRNSTLATNMGTVFKPFNYSGRWIRVWDNVNAKVVWFGAHPDDGLDDAQPIQDTIDSLHARKRGNAILDGGIYDQSKTIYLKLRTNLKGQGGFKLTELMSSSTNSSVYLLGGVSQLKMMDSMETSMIESYVPDGFERQNETIEDGTTAISRIADIGVEDIVLRGNINTTGNTIWHGIVLRNLFSADIRNCGFIYIRGNPVHAYDVNFLTMRDLWLKGGAGNKPSLGIFMYSSADNIIQNVTGGGFQGPGVWYNGQSTWYNLADNLFMYNQFATNTLWTASSVATTGIFTFPTDVPVLTGQQMELRTDGTLPTPFTDTQLYWAVRLSSTTFGIHTNYAQATNGVYLTCSGGSGNHSFTIGPASGIYMSGSANNNSFGVVRTDQNSGPGVYLRKSYGNIFSALMSPRNSGHENGETISENDKVGVLLDKDANDNIIFATISDSTYGFATRGNAARNILNGVFSSVTVERTNSNTAIPNYQYLKLPSDNKISIGDATTQTALALNGNASGVRVFTLERSSISQKIGIGVTPGGFNFWDETAGRGIGLWTFDGTTYRLSFGGAQASPKEARVQGNDGSGTDAAGGNLVLQAGLGTGAGTSGGEILVALPTVGSTGTTPQSQGYRGGWKREGQFAFHSFSSDPTLSLADGQEWFNSTVGQFKGRAASKTYSFVISLSGSTTWDIPNLAAAANSSTTITVTGAVVGDMVVVSPAMPSAGVIVAGDVTSADTVTIRGHNASGGAVDPPSTTYRVKVIRQ